MKTTYVAETVTFGLTVVAGSEAIAAPAAEAAPLLEDSGTVLLCGFRRVADGPQTGFVTCQPITTAHNEPAQIMRTPIAAHLISAIDPFGLSTQHSDILCSHRSG